MQRSTPVTPRSGSLASIIFRTLLILSLFATGLSASAGPSRSTPEQSIVADQNAILATLHTNLGQVIVRLNRKEAPITVKNFVDYAQAGFYDGTIFHRVISNFMAQGGGYTSDMEKKATDTPIRNESGNRLSNERGTIAMARTSAPHSATSQFFINLRDNPFLDAKGEKPGYAVFGKVVKGMEVVDKMAGIPTRRFGMHANLPVQPIVIERVEITDNQAGASQLEVD